MTDFTVEITADTVAWYAAIVATIGVVVHILNALKNRPKIKITLRKNWRVVGDNKSYLFVDVANVRRRPITITHVGFLTKKETFLLKDSFTQGAREITENRSTTYTCEDAEMPYRKLRKAVVIDATMRRHLKKVPRSWRKG